LRKNLVLAFGLIAACPAGASHAIDYRKPVRSLLEIRSEGVVMQKWDISCGAAALTTVMTYGFDDPTPERLAAKWMLSHGDLDKIKSQHGFSLLDLKRFAESRGYSARGMKDLTREDLAGLRFAIVPVIEYGVNPHFIVIRQMRDDGALDIADPGFGNRAMAVETFEDVWQGRVAFLLERKDAP
jgi:predicted double-glycine peptidase